MKLNQYLEKLFEIILLAGACALIYYAIKIIPALAAMGYTGETIGTASIISTVEDAEGHAGGTKHRVYVDYQVDGKDYFEIVIHGRFDNPQPGDTYHIRYNINNPEKCYVDSYPNNTPKHYATGLFVATVIVIVGLIGIKYIKPKSA